MYCSNCKKEILDGQNFCSYCGTKVIIINDINNNKNKSDEIDLTNKIIENKDNIENAVNYVMKSKNLNQPNARKYVDKVFKDNGIKTTTNNTTSRTTQNNVIKISFSKCVVLIILIAFLFVVPIIILSINNNDMLLSNENLIDIENSRKIKISGLNNLKENVTFDVLENKFYLEIESDLKWIFSDINNTTDIFKIKDFGLYGLYNKSNDEILVGNYFIIGQTSDEQSVMIVYIKCNNNFYPYAMISNDIILPLVFDKKLFDTTLALQKMIVNCTFDDNYNSFTISKSINNSVYNDICKRNELEGQYQWKDTTSDMVQNILQKYDENEIYVNNKDAYIDTFYNNSYYMYVYLTDEKVAQMDFINDLKLISGIYTLGQEDGKWTLLVKKDVYDKVYSEIQSIDGVKSIERTTTTVRQEDLNKIDVDSTDKYLMQIWGKDSKFLSREFYTFCSNYR